MRISSTTVTERSGPRNRYVAVESLPEAATGILAVSLRTHQGAPQDVRMTLKSLKVKLFADGADLDGMKEMAANPHDQGLHHQSRR